MAASVGGRDGGQGKTKGYYSRDYRCLHLPCRHVITT